MTREEEQLLLKDLCTRLPYGVIVRHADPFVDNDGNETGEFWYKRGYLCDINTLDDITTTIIETEGSDEEGYEHICSLERTVPYLRPMSSMTEEERKECHQLQQDTIHVTFDKYDEGYEKTIDLPYFESLVDFYNSHHLDYRGLIEKGLAIEVTKDNNPYVM